MENPKRSDIREKVLDRLKNLSPGAPMPTDREFVDEFGCSYSTVRRVMRNLRDEGLIQRRPGRGTHAAAEPTDRSPSSGTSAAAALARSLIECINKGELRKGDRLPSQKYLVATLGVSPATIGGAYRILAEEGRATRIGKAYRVGGIAAVLRTNAGRTVYFFGRTQASGYLEPPWLARAATRMEIELVRNGFRLRFEQRNSAIEFFDRWLSRAEPLPHGVVVASCEGSEALRIFSRHERLCGHFRPAVLPLVMTGGNVGSVPRGVCYISEGHLYTTQMRTLAEYLAGCGARTIEFFVNKADGMHSRKRFAHFIKFREEMLHLDSAATVGAVFIDPGKSLSIDSLTASTDPVREKQKLLQLASKYRKLSPHDIDGMVRYATSTREAVAPGGNADALVFSHDMDAVEALRMPAQNKEKKKRTCIVVLSDGAVGLTENIVSCFNDFNTAGYLMAHAIVGDIALPRSHRGYLEIPAVVLERDS